MAGSAAIARLADLGVPFDLGADKHWHLTREGGHSHRRIVHVHDATGLAVQQALEKAAAAHPNITLERERVDSLPTGPSIIATGPLTGSALAEAIAAETGEEALAFFDALAPIVHHETINMDIAWMASRWDKGDGKDYINCPLDEAQYRAFHQGLLDSDKAEFKEWETNTPYFEGCMPIEVMASRGLDTLRFGPMKPVGLDNPTTGRWAHAVVQLRQDNKQGTLWNMVGFQTKMKYAAQVDLLRTIPGLQNAEFARLGGLHRNTFIRSPILLGRQLRLKSAPHIRFAGQITGVEGYVESAAMGLLAARMAIAEMTGKTVPEVPNTTAMGALVTHITGGADAKTFQPMNVNFGLFPPLEGMKAGRRGRKDRYKGYTDRAKIDWQGWLDRLT